MFRKLLKICGITATLLFLILAFVGYQNARAMMEFNTTGEKTPHFESMSAWEKLHLFAFGFQRPRPQNQSDPSGLKIPFTDIMISAAKDRDIHLWKIPGHEEKPVFVLFHGFGGNLEKMLPASKILHRAGFPIYMAEFPGSGESSGNQSTIGILESKDVKAVFDYVRDKESGKKIILFGSSMGAAAITRAIALDGIKPDALVLESPFDSLLETLKNRFERLNIPAFPLAHLITGWVSFLCGANAFEHAPADYVKFASMPILLLHGEKDVNVTSAQINLIYQNIKSPKILQVFPEVGHKFFAQTSPELWENALSAFLKLHRLDSLKD